MECMIANLDSLAPLVTLASSIPRNPGKALCIKSWMGGVLIWSRAPGQKSQIEYPSPHSTSAALASSVSIPPRCSGSIFMVPQVERLIFLNFWRYLSILSIFYHRHVVTYCIYFSAFFSHIISISKSILIYFKQYINF